MRMRVFLTGGHTEYVYDMRGMYTRQGYEVYMPDQGPGVVDHKRPPFELGHTQDEWWAWQYIYDVVERGAESWHSLFGWNSTEFYTRSPSLAEFVYERAGDYVDMLVKNADFAHGLHAQYAAIFAPHIPFIYHLHGQTNAHTRVMVDSLLQSGALVVSYAESEAELLDMGLPVIHFGKDPEEWKGWTGEESSTMYMANRILTRREACHYPLWEQTHIGGRWVMAGENNEQLGAEARELTYDELQQTMRRARLFFNLGTKPAPYTLGVIEAAMTGMPVVSPVYDFGMEHPRYMVPDLLGDGCITMNRPTQNRMKKLLSDSPRTRKRMERIGEAARASAMRHFNVHTTDSQWAAAIAEFAGPPA